jgi:ABC-type multidrug transport system fused ATPase/permease subunit
MFVSMVVETLGIAIIIPAVALLSQQDIGTKYPALGPVLKFLGNPGQKSLVVGGMLVLVVAYVVKTLFLALLAWRQALFSYGVQARLSQHLFAIYLRQPYTFHLQRNSAQLVHNVLNEVSVFGSSAIQPGMLFIAESFVLIGLCTLLFLVEPVGALIVMCTLGSSAYAFYRMAGGRIAQWGHDRQRHEGQRVQHLQQGLGSAKDVILLGREHDFLERYRFHNDESARVGRLQSTLTQLPRLWLELLAVCGLAILVISMLAQGKAIDTVLPTLGLFAAAAFRVMPSVNRVLGAVQALRFGLPVIDTLHREFELMDSTANISRAQDSIGLSHQIELKNVHYGYANTERPSLQNVSLTVKVGEMVGFVGTSGAGKSTLVDVLLGLLTPDSGEVRVDGKNIQFCMRDWQDQIGYVPQSIFLTDDTLRRNVGFGLSAEQIDDTEVWKAIRAAQLEDFVRGLPEGLETIVGERGVRLSGGQRQRIGIARALYHDPAVLVLDEATSSLDAATEHSVMQAVLALRGKKTIIIVAHRPSAVEICGRVYRLERGQVVDSGSYESVARGLDAGVS